ncbi:MAG TPA: gamma-glutamyltransferase [Candidatus Acidoferrales bacterium]|nr:gamma-glutamyltransferase [Candidatus Acidoferrales bacterium]
MSLDGKAGAAPLAAAALAVIISIAAWALPSGAARAGVPRPFAQQPQAPQQKPERDFAAGEIPSPAWPPAAVRSHGAMVVSDESLANDAGLEILRQGGNAVDAAVAVAFALAVVEPEAGNIGGGGFLLLRMTDGRTSFIDYRETAPAAASRDMYLRPDGSLDSGAATLGYRASGVPGTVAGLDMALRVWGTMPLDKVMGPAIRLAGDGFPVSEKLARALEAARPRLERFPRSRRIFLRNGNLYHAGDTFKQPELARTLRRIARHGAAEFYSGGTAFTLVRDFQRNKGTLATADMRGYLPKIREPLRVDLHEGPARWEILSSPPPSSGGIALAGVLEMLDPMDLARWDSAAAGGASADAATRSLHWIAEALRRVFADRAVFLADPDFFHVPVRGLVDPRYAAERRATIDADRASTSAEVRAGNPLPFDATSSPGEHVAQRSGPAAEEAAQREAVHGGHTTHFSVVDAAGNAVSNTFTLNDSFGSAVTAPGGFLMNDTMDDFTAHAGTPNTLFNLTQSDLNTIAPGRRPVSSMTPTIVLRNGKLSFVAGSPGGPRIVSATLLAVLQWIRFGGDPQLAVNAPRIHHQWMPDLLYVEETVPAEVVRALEARGHIIKLRSWIGEVEAIGIDPITGDRLGAPDPRRGGAAAGLP